MNFNLLCYLVAAEVLYSPSQSLQGNESYLAIAIKEIVIGFKLEVLMGWLELRAAFYNSLTFPNSLFHFSSIIFYVGVLKLILQFMHMCVEHVNHWITPGKEDCRSHCAHGS